jgi:hypothetical protein
MSAQREDRAARSGHAANATEGLPCAATVRVEIAGLLKPFDLRAPAAESSARIKS